MTCSFIFKINQPLSMDLNQYPTQLGTRTINSSSLISISRASSILLTSAHLLTSFPI